MEVKISSEIEYALGPSSPFPAHNKTNMLWNLMYELKKELKNFDIQSLDFFSD